MARNGVLDEKSIVQTLDGLLTSLVRLFLRLLALTFRLRH